MLTLQCQVHDDGLLPFLVGAAFGRRRRNLLDIIVDGGSSVPAQLYTLCSSIDKLLGTRLDSQMSQGETALPPPPPPLSGGGGKPALLGDRRVVSLQLRPSRPLTRSDAVVPKSPDQWLDLPLSLPPPQPSVKPPQQQEGRTPTPSLKAITSSSVSVSSTTTDFLGVVSHNNRRRHSDSYFPQKRHHRRHKMRGILHPKYSYSPNPR
jgi:hypothetical protein